MSATRDALATVMNRNAFYRDGYRLLLKIALIEAFAIIVLVASLTATVLSFEPKHTFFATTADGRIINIIPLNEPFQSRNNVIAWAADVTKRVMEFGFHDYRKRLQDVSSNFTANGWETFTKALEQSRILEAVEARKLVVTAQVNQAPQLLEEGVVNGVYRWILRFPVTISFQGEQPPQPMRVNLTLVVVRVSTLQTPNGIGIEQWIGVPR